jgi:signal transduction histidine kinase/ActR/RegA family two-component response regulator
MHQRSLERKLTGWLGLILVVVVGSTWLAHRANVSVIENNDQVAFSHGVLEELDATLSTVKDAETGQRGYLITGSEAYLQPYDEAVASIGNHLRRLQTLTANNPGQARLLAVLAGHITTMLNELRETIDLRRRVSFEAAQAVVLTNEGKRTMDQIRGVVSLMERQENDLLRVRMSDSTSSNRQAQATALSVGTLAALVIAVFYFQVTRSVAERTALLQQEEQARQAAESAFRAEREARDRAEQASRLKDEFLATVSHELRTPLNAILGWARMLRAGTVDPSAVPRGLESIERNATAQAQLIEDLLDISRIVAGRLRLEVTQVDLVSVIRAAIDAVKPAADAKQILINVSADERGVAVSGDPQRLQQVVWNLLANSIKFTPAGGHVDVRLEEADSEARVSIRDSGEGISAEFLPHVFELFRQADAGPSRKQGGLGLGLAIVRRIVEMHGGTIRAESAGEGSGAAFIVELPLAGLKAAGSAARLSRETRGPASIGVPSLADAVRLDGLRILAVDDQRDALELIETVLTQSGAIVRTCTNADECLKLVQDWRPDVLIADIGLPEQDGYALIERLRTLDAARGGKTPAVAVTAYARVEDRMKILSAGYQMHVPKPVEPAELVTIVASLAGRPASPATA